MSESNLVISIDAMGGDKSPAVVIEGLALAHKRNPDIRFLVYGDEPKVTAEMDKYPALKDVCQIFHTEEFVHNEDKPSHVIRNRETSMYKAVEAVKNGQAAAVVSAGNTGALMAISKLVLKTIQKIHRPAIISIMPHISGKYVMLDLGANTDCDGINLAEFAIMGNIFAKYALGIERPRVALMNIGAEEMKGKMKATSRDEETKIHYWAIPGREGFEHRNGGLEKDYVKGSISTDPKNHQRMVDARAEKVARVAEVVPDLQVEGCVNDADLLVIGWGSTRGHLLSAVDHLNKKGRRIALAHFNYINPLPKNTAEIIRQYPKAVVCELNTGQFATYLRTKVEGVHFHQYNKVEGQPFTVHELEECFESLLK